MDKSNVLGDRGESFSRSLFGRPSSRAYRTAVAQVIQEVQGRYRLSDERLAELIGCSKQTVANARSEFPENDLNAVTILNIAYAFGEDAIEPIRALYLCAPVERLTASERCRRAISELSALEKELEA